MKYHVPKAPKQKPKHEKCAGKFTLCSPGAPLEQIEIGGTVYEYCRPCFVELNAGARKSGERVQKTEDRTAGDLSFTGNKTDETD